MSTGDVQITTGDLAVGGTTSLEGNVVISSGGSNIMTTTGASGLTVQAELRVPTAMTTLSRLTVEASTAIGGAVVISNSARQVADALVSVDGTAGQTALSIAGNLHVTGDLRIAGGLIALGQQSVPAAATITLQSSHAIVEAVSGAHANSVTVNDAAAEDPVAGTLLFVENRDDSPLSGQIDCPANTACILIKQEVSIPYTLRDYLALALLYADVPSQCGCCRQSGAYTTFSEAALPTSGRRRQQQQARLDGSELFSPSDGVISPLGNKDAGEMVREAIAIAANMVNMKADSAACPYCVRHRTIPIGLAHSRFRMRRYVCWSWGSSWRRRPHYFSIC